MTATITNSIIESFVLCKQKAYLELIDGSQECQPNLSLT